jgi:hypothetical protein
VYEAGYKSGKGHTKQNKGQGGVRGGYELPKGAEIRVLRAGNKSRRGGYKTAKELTEHMRGGYQPVEDAEISVVRPEINL